MRIVRGRWTPVRVFALIVGVALVLPGIGLWWASSVVHHAIARRAAVGNTAIAEALGAEVAREYDDRRNEANNLLVLLANGAHLGMTVADPLRLSSPFCRIDVLDVGGRSLHTLPLASCAAQQVTTAALASAADVVDLPAVVAPGGVGTAGLVVRLNAVERKALARFGPAQWLQVRFPVAALVTLVDVGHSGTYTIVDEQTGLILAATTPAPVGKRIAAPLALAALTGKRPAVLQTSAPQLRESVLSAYQPIARTPFGVFVSLPTAEAFADATRLRHVLFAGFAILLALGLAAAGVVAWLLARRDRALNAMVGELRHLASTDPLTGLPNRAQLMSTLESGLALVHRGSLAGLATVFIDLDGIKSLNDRRGHAIVDRLLVAVAEALTVVLRVGDTVARYGGDEFVLVAPGVTSADEAAQLADRICGVIGDVCITADDGELTRASASIGVSLVTTDDAPVVATDLLGVADSAMYRVKRRGGNGGEVAHPIPRQRRAQVHA